MALHPLTYNLMVVDSADTDRADLVFHALADSTRRDIVAVVLHSEYSVSDLARRYPMSFAAVQKHVALLERAGLITKRKHGREQRVSGNLEALRGVHHLLDLVETGWRRRIDRIEELLAEPTEGDPS